MDPKCGVEDCKFKYDPYDVEAYAKHILAKHKSDIIRARWAESVLHPENRQEPEPKMTLKSIIFGHGIREE